MIFGIIENKLFGGYWSIRRRYSSARGLFRYIISIIHRGYQYETNSYLPLQTKFSGAPNFPHGINGVFISGDAVIGKNCTIFHQVTVGSNMLLDSKGFGAPNIGDNCLFGAGAKVIGKITVGNNCRIGSNCVVTENVPDNCTVTLGKPIVIQKNEIISKIYTKSLNGWCYLENGLLIIETNKETIKKLENR